jgi:VWFA-related protein
MKHPYFLIFLVLFATCPLASYGQSGRADASVEGKKNQRQATPSPTPPATQGSVVAQPSNDENSLADDGEIIKVSTQLVSVPVRVMDKKGRFIGGLDKAQFKVFEDGQEQEIALFANENEPFTVALVIDMSYSTTFKIAEIQNAAISFIDQLRPRDKVMVVSFDEDVHVLCEATNDRKAIYAAIKSTKIATGTSLYEAMDLVMNDRLRRVDGRKAVILFTDGVDTTSRKASDFQNLGDAMELDSLIYTIRYDTFSDVQSMKNGTGMPPSPPITIPTPSGSGNPFPSVLSKVGMPSSRGTTVEEYEKAAQYLQQLADRTGGRLYEATTLTNLGDAYSKIASELREFYSISYYPAHEHRPGQRTNIKVKTDVPGAVVRSREIYIHRKK